jgi:hypothetical protein
MTDNTMAKRKRIQIKVKEQLVLRNDMDVHEHESLLNITPRHK